MNKKREQKVVASSFIVNSKGQILFLRRSENDNFMPGYWGFPGGKIESGETLEEGLKREVLEESGLDVEVSHPLTIRTFNDEIQLKSDRQFFEIFCLSELKDENQEVRLSEEHSEFGWFSFEEILSVQISDYMKDVVEKLKHHPIIKK